MFLERPEKLHINYEYFVQNGANFLLLLFICVKPL